MTGETVLGRLQGAAQTARATLPAFWERGPLAGPGA